VSPIHINKELVCPRTEEMSGAAMNQNLFLIANIYCFVQKLSKVDMKCRFDNSEKLELTERNYTR